MSEEAQKAEKDTISTPGRRGRSSAQRIAKVVAWAAASVGLLLVLLFVGAAWYTTTDDFQRRVKGELISTLEDATGGRVEVGRIGLSLWHLSVEVNGLVIHGLEGPGEAPYLAAQRVFVRVKITSLFGKKGSPVSVNYLAIEEPQVHLIIDKDGKTNQPVPKKKSQSNEPVTDTLLDLKAEKVLLQNGVALVNDRAIPFNVAAKDLNAEVHYIRSSDRYGATIDLKDLETQMQKQPVAKSNLHLEAELGRDAAELKAFDFHTGESSELKASGAIDHFANPVWRANVAGSLALKQLVVLAGVEGFDGGSVELDVAGHSCSVEPAVAQKKPSFFQRELKRKAAQAPLKKTLPPDPACAKGYLLVGTAKLHDAGFRNQYVRLHDVNGGAQLHITPTQLLFSALTGYLPGGGSAKGELKIDNWLGEVAADAPQVSATVKGATVTAAKTSKAITGTATVSATPGTLASVPTAHAYLTVVVDKISLHTITEVTAEKYDRLGFDTSVSGPVKAEWGGPAANIADTVQVDAQLTLAPVGHGARGDLPVTGQLEGHYDGRSETVLLTKLAANTPESSLTADGVLGVNLGDPLTRLNVDLALRNLGEYDQLLKTLGFAGGGKKGAAAIPVELHRSAQFHGTASGGIAKLDVKGHLEANNLDLLLGQIVAQPVVPVKTNVNLLTAAAVTPGTVPGAPATAAATHVHIDALVADAEYTPSGLAVASSTITQGTAVLHVAGAFKPRTVYVKRQPTYVWDDGTTIDAKVQLAEAKVQDVLAIAGQQSIPVTGTIAVDSHVVGTLGNLSGGGTVSLVNGVAYGEPYEAINIELTAQGKDIEAQRLTLKLHGMTIAGNGGYDLGTKQLHAHVQGNGLQLSKFTTVQNAKVNADGTLDVVLDAKGTAEQPGLTASIKATNLVADGKAIGEADLEAHSEGSTVFYKLRSTLVGAQVAADGQTGLTGNFDTKATVTLGGLDLGKAIDLFAPGTMKAQSTIAGVITVSGPAAKPMELTGRAQFSNFDLGVQGLTFRAAEPLTLSLNRGVATLDAVHITGPDTDLRLSGTAQVFGGVNAKTKQADMMAGRLDIKATGGVSMALAHTFDPDLITSGKVVFAMGIVGTLGDPALNGKVEFQKVNLAVEGIPNGLSDMNGTLVFTQDRLSVQTLTATTGGGQLKLGGFLTYRNGVYADLTAAGDAVRVRLYGLSATANATLRLQGGLQSAVLSGNILLTRFGVGADVDFAAFAGTGGVQAPPDPSAAANKIRLDVKVASSPQLDFQNSYAKLAGNVDLSIRGTVAEPTVLGRIQITDGSATFAGTKYQLQRGDVYFTNPVRIDPTIDLDATARVNNYDVTVGLHGTAANLKPTYRSEPPLSEADVFALLALGRTQEQAQIYQEQQVQAGTDPTTSSLLGGALNATVSNRVSKLFGGAGSVKIDPAFVGTLGNSSARITVQEPLSRQLTLTYATNVNSSAQQLIQVQYNLNENASIVATRDETGVFSIVYKIRRRYR